MGEGNGTPLQYSCLENPMDGGAWWAAVYGVAWSRTRLKQLSSSSSSSMVCISAEALQLRQTVQKCGQVELPLTQGQGRWPRGATPCLRSLAVAERSQPSPKVRGGGREELPHVHSQGLQLRGATPRPMSGCGVGAGGPRGATPRSRSWGQQR